MQALLITLISSIFATLLTYFATEHRRKKETKEKESWEQYNEIKTNIIDAQNTVIRFHRNVIELKGILSDALSNDEGYIVSASKELNGLFDCVIEFRHYFNNIVDYNNLYRIDDVSEQKKRPEQFEYSIEIDRISYEMQDDYDFMQSLYNKLTLLITHKQLEKKVSIDNLKESFALIKDLNMLNSYKTMQNNQQSSYEYFSKRFKHRIVK